MMQETEGLTILTQGGGDMLYGRRGEEIHRMQPFDITVRSTLGAGDTFKAGCVYALWILRYGDSSFCKCMFRSRNLKVPITA